MLPEHGQRAVAQLGSALDWGSRGREFKSRQPHPVCPCQSQPPPARQTADLPEFQENFTRRRPEPRRARWLRTGADAVVPYLRTSAVRKHREAAECARPDRCPKRVYEHQTGLRVPSRPRRTSPRPTSPERARRSATVPGWQPRACIAPPDLELAKQGDWSDY